MTQKFKNWINFGIYCKNLFSHSWPWPWHLWLCWHPCLL